MKPITKQSITKMMEEELANMQTKPQAITKNKIKNMMEEEFARMQEEDEDDINQEVVLKSKMQCAYAGMEFQGQISDEEAAAFFRKMADIAEQRGDFGAIVDDLRAEISGKPKPEAAPQMTNHWAQQEGLSEARKRPLKRHRDAFDKNTQMVSDLQKTISSFLKESGAKLNKNHMNVIETMSTRLMHIANSPMIKLSEGDANSRMISSLEKIGEEIKGIAHMSVDPAILERLELVEEMIQQLWQDMMGVQ